MLLRGMNIQFLPDLNLKPQCGQFKTPQLQTCNSFISIKKEITLETTRDLDCPKIFVRNFTLFLNRLKNENKLNNNSYEIIV